MSVLEKLATSQGRRDDLPNQELARELVATGNLLGIQEIVENLYNRDKKLQSDCLKVLYEVGYLKPELIGGYVSEFLKLLQSGNNRLVWGAMIALANVAELQGEVIYLNLETIYHAMKEGSVITIDNGIKVLAKVAAQNKQYNQAIFPYLMHHLKNCRPKEVAQHSESILVAVNLENKQQFIEVLKIRENSLSQTQIARIKKLYRAVERL